jgi:hypothetical protein
MEPFAKRAFFFGVVFTFSLLLLITCGSAADPVETAVGTNDKSGSANSGSDSVPKVINADETSNNGTAPVKKPVSASDTNCTNSNSTECQPDNKSFFNSMWNKVEDNKDMLMRTMYVLLGVTGIVVIYFMVKAIR